MRMALLSMMVLGLTLAAGCGGGEDDDGGAAVVDDGRPIVVATTTMIADLARVIGGEDVNVVGIMRSGEDPHVYEMKPRDTQAIGRADLVLMNGLHLEAQIDHVVENHADGLVVRLAESDRIKPLGTDELEGAPDPHVWFNIDHYKVFAERTRDALAQIDPDHAEAYRARAQAYLVELDELQAWVREQVSTVPRDRRVMVTSHDAFGYLGDAYDIEVHAVIGMSTEQIPTGRDKIALQQLVTDRGAKAVFIESSVSQALNDMVTQIADATGAKVGGTLHSDSLGEPGTEAGTYLGMMRHNVKTLVEALR